MFRSKMFRFRASANKRKAESSLLHGFRLNFFLIFLQFSFIRLKNYCCLVPFFSMHEIAFVLRPRGNLLINKHFAHDNKSNTL